MASKNQNGNNKASIDPIEEYRTRFMYCSIGATLMCLGVIVLVSGLVVYIVSATGPNNYVNNMLIHHQHDYNQTYWPIIIAIILSSSGIAFITIAIVFTLLACFSHGRIEDHFNNNNRNSSSRNNHPQHYHRSSSSPLPLRDGVGGGRILDEEQRLLPAPNELNRNESNMAKSFQPIHIQQSHPSPAPPPPPPPPPITAQPHIHHHNVSVPQQEKQPPLAAELSSSRQNNRMGDLNTIGLPLAYSTAKKVPHNGFSYLTHPEEIQIYHEFHQRQSRHHPHHTSHTPSPPTRATVTSHESVI